MFRILSLDSPLHAKSRFYLLTISFLVFYLLDPYYIYGPESKLCMERSAVFRTYGTKGLRNWSCSGPLECDEI